VIDPASTQRLSSARLELASDLRARTLLRSVLVIVLVALAAIAGLRLLSEGAATRTQRAELQKENTALRTELARLQAEYDLERATRETLGQQVDELNRRIADLDRQLEFFHAQSGRARTAAAAN
jgi:septal ring factor EnvC (AmiA/AmiB activator)